MNFRQTIGRWISPRLYSDSGDRGHELLAEKTGLNDADVARVAIGGFLHDLGKIGISDTILRKPRPLDADEFDIIRTHPAIGGRLLAAHPLAALARPAVESHHERFDGRGYPRGLPGEEIPLDARIVAICDAFDAMTSTPPYRTARALEPLADVALITRLIQAAVVRAPLAAMLERSHEESYA